MKKYNKAVVIGRLQILHNGQLSLFKKASSLADEVVVVIGSVNCPPSIDDPFSLDERRSVLFSLPHDYKITNVVGVEDSVYSNDQWLNNVQTALNQVIKPDDEVCLVGHKKDSTSFYLDLFPQWDFIECENVDGLNATTLRDYYFNQDDVPSIFKHVPPQTFDFLVKFKETAKYQYIRDEARFVSEYKQQWKDSPYPPIFVTVDAVVIQSGHVLMVKRGAMPGKGLWALPGGFVNQTEFLLDAAIRELNEETKIKISELTLRKSVTKMHVFDAPFRSVRGRTISNAFLIELVQVGKGLPKVKGGDDAAIAKWIPLSDVVSMRPQIFEDHLDIIKFFVGV